MEFVRRSWAQIRAYLAGLSFSERALVIMSVVVLVVVLAWILPLLVKPEMEKVPNFAGDRQPEAVQRLQAAGIKATIVNGELMVPAGKTEDALGILAQSDLLSGDITAAFDEYVNKQSSPLISNTQNARYFLMAKEKVLSKLVSKMAGVKAATVMVSMPEEQGFGRDKPKPTASVTVFMKGRSSVDKPLVAAIAGLVAGANSPMKAPDVVVVDAVNGRSLTTGSDEDNLPTTALAQIRENEERYRSKIEDSLSYIVGRVVSVTVQIDPKVRSELTKWDYNRNEPLISETSKTNKSTDTTVAGEPGPRTNVGTESGAGGTGSTREENTTSTTYGSKEMIGREQTVKVGLLPTQVNVNVGVPRSYFISLYKLSKPADKAAEPDEAALAPIVQSQLAQIEGQVQNLITADGKGAVKAYVMNTDTFAITPASAQGTGGSGLLAAIDSGWARPVGLAMLALVSLTLMFGMVRKATRQQPMPTVQELAGVPPTLPTEDDLVGEADGTDPSMAGVELDEDELRTRKIAQQIGEMVKTNPAEAASLVRRWVRTEE